MNEPNTIPDLMREYNWTIPARQRDNWRALYPNVGWHQGYRCSILATDGLLAAFNYSGTLVIGHLKNFVGPVAKVEIDERDWDWDRNVRKVSVFKRRDGTVAIIPQDTPKAETEKALREAGRYADRAWNELAARIVYIGGDGQSLLQGDLTWEEFDEAYAAVKEATTTAGDRRKSERARILEMI